MAMPCRTSSTSSTRAAGGGGTASASGAVRSSAQLPRLPAFGLVPWFAFDVRAFIFFLAVFFDIGGSMLRGRVRTGPGHQVVGAHRVHDLGALDAVADGLVAAERLPLELPRGVGVGVDGDPAVPLEGEVEQPIGWVLAL